MVEQRGGVKNKSFFIGQKVLCKNFSQGGKPWVMGKILAQQGTLTYVVEIGPNKFVKRHFNQLIRLNDDESQPSQVIDLGMEDSESPSSTSGHRLLVAQRSNENLAASNRDNMVTAAGSHDNESLSTTIPNNNESPIPVTTQNEINGSIALEQQTSPEPEVSVPRYPRRNRNAPANLRDYDLSTSEGL